jgi:hypothetical protein
MNIRPLTTPQQLLAVLVMAVPMMTSLQPQQTQAADALTGRMTLGYRDVNVADNNTKFRQQVNLDDGVRLFDLGLVFKPAPDAAASIIKPDRVTLDASGLGGDPAQTLRLDVKKSSAYRLRFEHRRSDYFYEDLLLRAEDASIEGSTGGDFHHFDFQRQRDRADLDIDLSQRAALSLGFDRMTKQGSSITTQDIQREEFELDKPVDETSKRYSLGFRYAWDRVTLVLDEHWQDYDNGSRSFLPGYSGGSDPDAPTTLDIFSLAQPYQFNNREHHAGLRVRPDSRWDVKFDARLSDLDLHAQAVERAQGTDFTGAPFIADGNGKADLGRDLALYDLAIDWFVSERVRLTTGAHRHHLNQDGILQFDAQEGENRWEIDTTGVELGVEVAINNALTAALGVSRERRATRSLQAAGAITDTNDIDTQRTGYSALLNYQPNRRLTITLSSEVNSITDPFTLASATDSRRWRLRGHYRWENGLMLSGALRRTDRDNNNSAWSAVSDQADLRLSWQTERLTVSLGMAQVDQSRNINQLVAGGTRIDLIPIDFKAETDFADASVQWRLSDRIGLSASYRTYENDGSFGVERDDARAGIDFSLGDEYQVLVSYRNLDYEEDRLEAFDADLWEVALRLGW